MRGVTLFVCISIAVTACSTVPPNPVPTAQLSELSNRQLNNLVAFARLLGYVQYFHPSDQANDTDWTQFAVQGLAVIEDASNSAGLASRLNRLFQPVAPTLRVFGTDQDPPPPASELLPPAGTSPLWIVAWRHHGFGGGVEQEIYYSERIHKPFIDGTIPSDLPDPRKPFRAELGGGVSALIPLALFADEAGTLPHPLVSTQATYGSTGSATDEKTLHLATVILAWNVFQHFYPYFDAVQTDWLGTLREALIGADSAEDEEQFLNVLRVMVAQLHDGHAQIPFAFPDIYRPPFGWDWVEDHLAITFVEEGAEGQLQRGDVVTAIDGQPIASVLDAQERLISGATPQWIRFSALKNLLEGPKNSTFTLTLKPFFGLPYQATLKRTVYLSYREELLFTEQRPPPASELKPGVWYMDLARIGDYQFNQEVPQLTKASGIIFDLRGYPFNVGLEPISHIIQHPVDWPQLNIPIIMYPDHQKLSFDRAFQTVEPIPPYFPAKIAFITDGRAISYAESYLGIIESNKIADIVGAPTAGTNGNIALFTLFGRYTFRFTGMQVLKLDGTQHHGIGIQPTVPVTRTLRGVRAGRDEYLGRAIEIVAP